MLIAMTYSAPIAWQSGRRRMAACLSLSLAAHLIAMIASVPSFSIQPRTALPSIEVRLLELSPAVAPKPVAGSQAKERPRAPEPAAEPTPENVARAADAAPQAPATAAPADTPRTILEAPQAPKPLVDAVPPAVEPALTEAEKALLNPRFLAESAVERKATSLDEAVSPEYPPAALKQGITGCVLLMVYINANGMVEDIDVIRSDPPGVFDRDAMRAFTSKRYLPAMKGNLPVRSRVPGVASFELEGKPPLYCALRYYPLVTELNGQPAAPAAQR